MRDLSSAEDEEEDISICFEEDLGVAKIDEDQLQQELMTFEYHILYHLSYAVPYLSFNAHKCGRFRMKGRVAVEETHRLA